jgi:hypothetical protein
LASARKKYIARLKSDMAAYKSNSNDFFSQLITEDIGGIQYLRAIQEEFEIDIYQMISDIIN